MTQQPATFFDALQMLVAEPPDTFEIHGKRYIARSFYERLLTEIEQLKKQIKSYEQTEKE
jgi:hypothetical protein